MGLGPSIPYTKRKCSVLYCLLFATLIALSLEYAFIFSNSVYSHSYLLLRQPQPQDQDRIPNAVNALNEPTTTHTSSSIAGESTSASARSCLNAVFARIFVISIPRRLEVLRATLLQLSEAGIEYTLWQGHSHGTNRSAEVWREFRASVDTRVAAGRLQRFTGLLGDRLYDNAAAFFLRQTGLDIIAYAQQQRLDRILVLEDDLILADAAYIEAFCAAESGIAPWLVLTLGQNEGFTQRIPRHSTVAAPAPAVSGTSAGREVRYFAKNDRSWGCFAIAFAAPVYSVYREMYALNSTAYQCQLPLDKIFRGLPPNITRQYFGVDPPLVLPDVSQSDLRGKPGTMALEQEMRFVRGRTVIANVTALFSHNWHLRFAQDQITEREKKTMQEYDFDSLIKDSPSLGYIL